MTLVSVDSLIGWTYPALVLVAALVLALVDWLPRARARCAARARPRDESLGFSLLAHADGERPVTPRPSLLGGGDEEEDEDARAFVARASAPLAFGDDDDDDDGDAAAERRPSGFAAAPRGGGRVACFRHWACLLLCATDALAHLSLIHI